MSTGVNVWSKTAATNNTADSAVNWQEGQPPSSVNDSARGMMAATAKWRDDLNGTVATSGSSTAYVATSNQVFAALTASIEITCQFDEDCGATVTLNVDGLGAKPLRSAAGVELVAGAIKAGSIHRATYFTSNSGEWILHDVNPTIIAAGQVVTASIADANVTYAKIQNVTNNRVLGNSSGGAAAPSEQTLSQVLDMVGSAADGDILYRSGGAWTRRAKGTDGQYLLLASGVPTWGASPGLVLISTQVASNSATIDFTGLDNTYEAYEIVLSNVKPQNDDVQMTMRIGTGGGPTYQTSGYSWTVQFWTSGNITSTGSSSSGFIGLSIVSAGVGVGNASGENYNGEIRLGNPGAADFPEIRCSAAYSRADGSQIGGIASGRYNTAGAITAIRFLFSSGNIVSGRFSLYGFRKS